MFFVKIDINGNKLNTEYPLMMDPLKPKQKEK